MNRAVSPVVGVVLLCAITVIAAASVGLAVAATPLEPVPAASFELSADHEQNSIAITHLGGETLDLTAIEIRLSVDGEELAAQPPVPFFAASGFESGPTGPFNSASPNQWSAGETGTFELATTNHPLLEPGSTVTVVVLTEGEILAELETTA